jgi:hypothetical protein
MKGNIVVTLILIGLLFFTGCKREDRSPQTISVILPFDKNPSGNWHIGYSLHDTLSMAQFRLSSFADTSHVIGLWHPGNDLSGYYPYIGQNRTTNVQLDPTGRWAARPGEIVMEGSNTGQFSMLEFIVPASGNYKIAALFEGVHIGLSTTDVHILMNDVRLFDDIIDGYGGDPSFSAQKGPHPVAAWTSTIYLKTGDVLTFALGYGSNKTFYNDTTGLMLSIEMT